MTEIDGRYVVDGEIGGGGMGVVLRARHRFTGAEVAIKMLRPHLAVDPEVQDRFLAEARAPTAIGHKGIVSVIDAGKTPAGELYLVMELLAGRPLRAALTAGGLAPQDVQRIGLELLDALGAAHARGFVHRDLKPENVFLCDPLGSVKLLDFGIAKIKSADAPNPRTQAGALLGTLAYMAPEQLLDARSVDARADLWAVGVMLYEMLTGRLPYDARSMPEMYVALSSTEPTPIATYLPRAPVDVLGFFRRALARDPAQRFQSAKDMVDALATLSILPAARGPGSGVVTAYTGGVWAQPLPSAAQVGAAPLPSAAPAGSAHGTPAGSAHNAPPRVAPTVHVTPQPAAAPRIAAPPPPRRGKGLAIGLGVLSVAAIATAIVVASRGRGGGEPTKPGDEPTIADNKKIVVEHGQDVPLPPVQPAPAQPAPVQPAPQPAPPPRQPQPAPQPQPKPKPVDPTCVAQCKVLAGCGGVAGCVDKCNANANVHACFARVQGCAMLGLCLLDGLCQPRGGATCSQTAQCYAACGKNDDCVCRCTKQASPQVAGLLGQIIACAFECHGDTTCANQRCGAQLQTCSRM